MYRVTHPPAGDGSLLTLGDVSLRWWLALHWQDSLCSLVDRVLSVRDHSHHPECAGVLA